MEEYIVKGLSTVAEHGKLLCPGKLEEPTVCGTRQVLADLDELQLVEDWKVIEDPIHNLLRKVR